MDVRFGVVGTSWITSSFIAAARTVPGRAGRGCLARAAASPPRRSPRPTTLPRIHVGLDALAADDSLDAVYIGSPNAAHADQAIALLRAGKHVLVEKPMGVSAAQVEAMTAAAAERRAPAHGGLRRAVPAERGGDPRRPAGAGDAAPRGLRQGPVLVEVRRGEVRADAQRLQPRPRRRRADGPRASTPSRWRCTCSASPRSCWPPGSCCPPASTARARCCSGTTGSRWRACTPRSRPARWPRRSPERTACSPSTTAACPRPSC